MRFVFLFFSLFSSLLVHGQLSLNTIQTIEEFKKLSSSPLNYNLGQVRSIKVVVELSNKKVHFIDSNRFPYHYVFCIEQLNCGDDIAQFNQDNYGTSNQRRFLLANINYLAGSNKYFVDLSVFDNMSESAILLLMKRLKQESFFGADLQLLLNTTRLLALKESLSTSIGVMLPEDLYANQNVQEVAQGSVTGQLRIISDLDSMKNFSPTDILVLKGTPAYFPNVRGILLDEFQTPLSHLVILGKNRRIPIVAKKDLFSDTTILGLNGKWVKFEVTMNGFRLIESKPAASRTVFRLVSQLTRDTSIHNLIPVSQFRFMGSNVIGNKAANFGVLAALQKSGNYATPEDAFAIPFSFYVQHIQKGKAKVLIDSLLIHPPTNDDSLKLQLKRIRDVIKSTPIEATLLQTVDSMLSLSEFTTFRFRSSTNAEDALGFSGAGLYVSKTVAKHDSIRTIARAITTIWASCWTFEAYQERRFFDLSDSQLAMAILVHRSFPNEKANGVIITKNVYRSGYPGISINVQVGDISVVEPPDGINCDQLTIIHEVEESNLNQSIEYIGTSSLNDGVPILSVSELREITRAVEIVKQYFWKSNKKYRQRFRTYDNFGLDIEFKLEGEVRKLYLKQVRVYNN